jgi:hypothetical protein
LSVDLIQIDLERIVSQFVRDTEKNLDALFKAARLRTPCSCSTTRITCLPANRPPGIPVANPGSTSPSCDSIESYDGVVVLGTDDATRLYPKLARQATSSSN